MNRREFLILSSATAVSISLPSFASASAGDLIDRIHRSKPSAIAHGGVDRALQVNCKWTGDRCRATVRNQSARPVRVKEVVLFTFELGLSADTRLYGEGFQMLSQSAGTLGQPVDLGYSELRHYKIPQPESATALSGLLMLSSSEHHHLLLAFTSCRRFIGRFYLQDGTLMAALDTEGRELAPGETWELEELMVSEGAGRPALLLSLADRIKVNHPHKMFRPIPTGWCSWYCFGSYVTAQDVLANLEVISKQIPGLKYIQIDDGYQSAMGDWLETGKAFGGDVIAVLKKIKQRGFEPAIWVAPFIAELNSHVFQQHPDWFIQGEDGKPLPADRVTFGGWRHAPWFALDGTHPEVQQHLEQVFRRMREEWGCTYFKLDAIFWGAMHGGTFHDKKATRIEAYRRGMCAIRRGAGDSFILGCNHPIWPSFGLIDGSRSSGDIKRSWPVFAKDARQGLDRNWQNGTLWWNDPDAVLLTGKLSDEEFRFHATAIYASGGLVLSGDDLSKISPERLEMLKKLIPPTGVAAKFEDESLRVGSIEEANRHMVCMFNWQDTPQTIAFNLPRRSRVTDFWSGEDLGQHSGAFTAKDMPPHSAKLLVVS